MSDVKKYKAVIVDDDRFLLSMYSLKFSKEGLQVNTIADPMEALEKIRGGLAPDILMLDIVMPNLDGLELLRKIRDEKLLLGTVVIILSNQGQQSDIDKAKELGVQGYIVKATSIPSEVCREVIRIMKENGK